MIVSMRRGDDDFDAVIRRAAAHLQRFFEAVRAVIDLRQDVTMNINHRHYVSERPAISKGKCKIVIAPADFLANNCKTSF